MTPLVNYKLYMDMTDVPEGDASHVDGCAVGAAYTIRKGGGEVSVAAKSVAYVGGVEGIARRLVAIWLAMPEHYRTIGLHWYDDASAYAQNLATVYNLTLWQTAQVIAVLSPQNPWDGAYRNNGTRFKDGNRLCSLNVIKAWFQGNQAKSTDAAWTEDGADAVMALHGWGYAPDFLAKAVKVLKGEELDWSTAPKTYRFALLIADPKRTDIAVIDSHASRVATGNLGNRYHVVAASAYKPIEDAYMLAASLLNIPAYVLQAGTWQFAVDGNLY